MANLITLIRLLAVFVIGAIALYAPHPWQLLNAPLIIINILLDGLDGMVARWRHEDSVFGAIFDIAADRIIECVLWMILAAIGTVSIWIPIIIVTRGVLIDSLRKPSTVKGKAPLSIMKTEIGKFLVASRTMRCAIGLFKLITFSWVYFLIPAHALWPQTFMSYYLINDILVYTTVAICLARGIPVILEAILCKD